MVTKTWILNKIHVLSWKHKLVQNKNRIYVSTDFVQFVCIFWLKNRKDNRVLKCNLTTTWCCEVSGEIMFVGVMIMKNHHTTYDCAFLIMWMYITIYVRIGVAVVYYMYTQSRDIQCIIYPNICNMCRCISS